MEEIIAKFKKFEGNLSILRDTWKTSYLFYKGEQWKKYQGERIFDLTLNEKVRDNFLFRVNSRDITADTNRLISKLINVFPQVKVLPHGDTDEIIRKAELAQIVLNDFLNELKENFEELIFYLVVYGSVAIYFDVYIDKKKVKIEPLILPPFRIIFNPQLPLSKQKEVFIIKFYEEEIIKKMYPDIKSFETGVDEVFDEVGKVKVIEYLRFPSFYIEGKRIIFTGNTILNPKNTQYPYTSGDNFFKPFAFTYFFMPSQGPYGISAVELARAYQFYLNFFLSMMINQLALMGGGKVIAQEGSLLEPITNIMSPILYYKKTSPPPVFTPGTQMPASIPTLFEILKIAYRNAINIQEVDIGRAYASDPARKVAYLRAFSTESISIVADNIKKLIRKASQIYLNLVSTFFDSSTPFKVITKDGEEIEITKKELPKQNEYSVEATLSLPYSEMGLIQMIFENALQRLTVDPTNVKAQQIVDMFYEQAGISFYTPEDPDVILAKWENRRMLKEEDVEVSEYDNHLIHLMVHIEEIKKPVYRAKFNKGKIFRDIFVKHIEEHKRYLREGEMPVIDKIAGKEIIERLKKLKGGGNGLQDRENQGGDTGGSPEISGEMPE